MTKIVKTNVLELILLDNVLEVRSHEVRCDQISVVVTAYKAVILPVKVFSEELRVVFLKCLAFSKHLLDMRNQGECSNAGLGFKLIFDKDSLFTATISA